MTKLEKVMIEKGLIWNEDEVDILLHGIEYDNCCTLQFVTKGFVVTKFDSAVLPSEFRIYDRNFNLIATQNVHKDSMFGWESYCCFE